MKEKIFNIQDVENYVDLINSGLHVPFINTYSSSLGGDEKVSIMIKLSLDKRENWPNNIFNNSRYMHISIDNDGTVKNFTVHPRELQMRKFHAKSVEEAIKKINNWIDVNHTLPTIKNPSEIDFILAKINNLTSGNKYPADAVESERIKRMERAGRIHFDLTSKKWVYGGTKGNKLSEKLHFMRNPLTMFSLGTLYKCEVISVRKGKPVKYVFNGDDSIGVYATADKKGIIITPVRVPK